MRPKACAKCRQWKVRCDLTDGHPGGCSRCRSLKVTCVFDAKIKRTTKATSVRSTSSEIPELQQALPEPLSNNGFANDMGSNVGEMAAASNLILQPSAVLGEDTNTQMPVNLPSLQPRAPGLTESASSTTFHAPGGVALTLAQATELFRIYFARCHSYLPFSMTSRCPESIHSKSALLFWVISATSASWTLRSRLEPIIKSLVADSICSVSQNLETVQALLILSTWPFPVSSLNEDPSYYYSGISWQMSLQLGLHRPLETHSHQHGSELDSRTEHEEVKITTWLASAVVNILQSTYRGVPPSILVDIHLLNAFSHPNVDPKLSQLCRISYLLMQSTLAISSNNPTASGMLEPEARLTMIAHYAEQFATLQLQYLQQADDIIMTAFLSSRAQLWSFALLHDVPPSRRRQEFFERAKGDAVSLIELCYGKNLSVAPYHVRRSMCFSAFVLIRALHSRQTTEPELLVDMIERVCQSLQVNPSSPNDVILKASTIIRALPEMKDRKLRPPILSRMGASIVYDSLRIYVENSFYGDAHEDQAEDPIQALDLDGTDWYSLDPLL